MRAGQQAIDQVFIGLWIGVGDEGIDLRGSGWQADQIGVEPADECGAIGFRGGSQTSRLQTGQNEAVDFLPWPVGPLDAGGSRLLRGHKRPVWGIFGPAGDPS